MRIRRAAKVAASSAMLAVLSFAWVRSELHFDAVSLESFVLINVPESTWRFRAAYLTSESDALRLAWRRGDYWAPREQPPQPWHLQYYDNQYDAPEFEQVTLDPPSGDWSYGVAGIAVTRVHLNPIGYDGAEVSLRLPYGALCIAAVAWLSLSILRSGKPRRGVCSKCGYDLRATPDRCPECGQIPATPATPPAAA